MLRISILGAIHGFFTGGAWLGAEMLLLVDMNVYPA